MKRMGVALTVIALSASPAFAANEALSLATMTCRQFIGAPKDTEGMILAWMMGYLRDPDEPAEINFSKMEDLAKKLGVYCAQNPAHGVMNALDQVSDAGDSPDALKSLVGVWTFEDKQVWVVIRPDGSAMQCRIGPDGAVFFSTGTFRAPDVLAWEKIWGDDKVSHDKDAITLTGKFGSFSFKPDNSGGPSNRCQAT
jgi:acid stress chaperone HdeB